MYIHPENWTLLKVISNESSWWNEILILYNEYVSSIFCAIKVIHIYDGDVRPNTTFGYYIIITMFLVINHTNC